MCVIDQACLIKMATYWPSSFFVHNKPMRVVYIFFVFLVFCSFLQLHCPHCPKIEKKNFKSLPCNVFSHRIKVGNPKQAREAHLACWGSQSKNRIHFILTKGAASDIINSYCHSMRFSGKILLLFPLSLNWQHKIFR